MGGVTSYDIKLALKEMHDARASYFITECKTCSSYFPDPQGLLIFDGLAIKKSYTKPCITGYEIKISRSDFLQDAKWHLYLQYCNEFFFVVPKGLIRKEELPENVGLIYYYPETGKLHTVKKALHRKIEEPIGVYKYIIYSRLEEDRIPFYSDRAEYARDYLKDKQDKKYVGDILGTKLAKDVSAAYQEIENIKRGMQDIDTWKAVKRVLEENDILSYWNNSPDKVEEKLRKSLQGSYPKGLDSLKRKLRSAAEMLERIEKEYSGGSEEEQK